MNKVHIRIPHSSETLKLSVLFKQVYLDTYGAQGISDEFANFTDRQFAPEHLKELMDAQDVELFVAEQSGLFLGAIKVDHNRPHPLGDKHGPEINKLYVLRNYHGKGVAESLLEAGEARLRECGFGSAWLWVLESNTRAIRFYQKHGYSMIGKAPFAMETNTYMNNVMEKQLSA